MDSDGAEMSDDLVINVSNIKFIPMDEEPVEKHQPTYRVDNYVFYDTNTEGYDESKAGKAYVYLEDPSGRTHVAHIYEPNNDNLIITYKNFEELNNRPTYSPSVDDFSIPTILPIEDFTIEIKAIKEEPSCKWLVPRLYKSDAPLELYDRPFTSMPIEDTCINPALGNSAHRPGKCRIEIEVDLPSCDAYDEVEELQVGVVSEVPVTVKRTTINNIYKIEDKEFKSYEDMLAWCKDNSKDFELTYRPDTSDKAFSDQIKQRFGVFYG